MTKDKKKKLTAASCIALFILLSAAICWFIGRPMLKFVSDPGVFRDWVNSHGIFGRIAFVGMMLLQIFVAIIPGEPLEIGAGYAFGMWEGTLLCLISSAIGSLLIFLFVKNCGMKAVEIFFPKEKIQSLRFLQQSKKRDMWVLIIFLIPGTPKDLLSYFAGLTDIKLTTWLLISSFGRIPSIVTSTIGGDALGMQNYVFALIVLAATLIISIIGILIYRRICRRQSERCNLPCEQQCEQSISSVTQAVSSAEAECSAGSKNDLDKVS